MSVFKTANLVSIVGLMVFCSSTASTQTTESTGSSADIPFVQQRANADAMVMRAKNRMNLSDIPEARHAHAEADDGLLKGAMTKDGAIYQNNLQRAFGSFGIPYTTTRVQDGARSVSAAEANRQSTTYPYRTIGKLTYRDGTNTFACSASVIRRGIIVTAAHCIQDFGSGNNIFTTFRFRPGHYGAAGATASQIAPYGTWVPFRVTRSTSWVNGTDTGCNDARANDLAVMAVRRQGGQFIGDRVGYLGYGWNNYSFVSSPKTGNLSTAAVSTLGYPGLLDGGRIMQRTDGPTYTTTVCGAPQLWQGSNLTGGSSGGPWIVNFATRKAVRSGGAVEGQQSGLFVIGVTSWGSANPNNPKDNYSSQFRQNAEFPNGDYGGYGAGNIGALLDSLCGTTAPEGGTLEARGYCD